MNSRIVFDTETTSLDKPFVYNIGYMVVQNETNEVLVRRDYVVEQIWHNLPLFQSAYYADKRPLYVSRMKAKTVVMEKFGYICQQIIRDIKAFNVTSAYAYNSPFDERVFAFNSDWFKCSNPFDLIPIYDIRGYAIKYIVNDEYKDFCEKNKLFTENGNYSTTAETMYRFLTRDTEFNEEHTALADSEIESLILNLCLYRGADLATEYEVPKSVPRETKKLFTVKMNGETILGAECKSIVYRKSTNTVILKK